MAAQKRMEDFFSLRTPTVTQTLLTADKEEQLAITKWLIDAAQESQVIELKLDGIGVSDVGPLSGLGQLQTLDLSGTGVSDLTPFVGLKKLSKIYLREGQKVQIPEPLEKVIQRSRQ